MEDYQVIVYLQKWFRQKIIVYGIFTVDEAFEQQEAILEEYGNRVMVEVVRLVHGKTVARDEE